MTTDSGEDDTAGRTTRIGSRLLKGSSLYLAANFISKIIGFVMIPFYARFLSVDEYGVLNLIELATTIVAISFGLQSIGQSLVRIYHDQTDEAQRRSVVSTAVFGTMALAGVVVLFGVAFSVPLAHLLSLDGQVGVLRLAFLAMFFSSLAELPLVYQRMHDRAQFYLIYAVTTLLVNLSLNILLIGWWHLGVRGFVYSKLVVSSAGCLFLLTRTLREVGVAWHPSIARALVRFAGPLIISGGCYFAIHFADRLFLAHVSRADVGVYALAYNFAFLLSILIGDSFNKSWGVSFYSYASGEGWQNRFVQVGRWLVFVLGAGSMGISLFGRDVLVLMVPASYDPPVMLLPLLVFGYFLREVGDFFNSMLLIGSGSGLVGRIAIAGAVLNLALNAMLIPHFGIWGAAWATFCTWGAYCVVCWIGAWRLRGVAMRPWPLLFMLALSACCLSAQTLWSGAAAPPRLVLDGIAFAAFLGLAIVFYLGPAERGDAWVFARKGLAAVGLDTTVIG